MSNSNLQITNCDFAEPLVSYLYGEIGGAEKIAFEAHLVNCSSCDRELKEFGFARTAVREWRAADFDNLATPVFELPMRSANVLAATEKTENRTSRFGGWREIFSFKLIPAMSAAAVLVALFGAAWLVFNFQTNDRIAEITVATNEIAAKVSPSNEKTVETLKQTRAEIPVANVFSASETPDKVSAKKTATKISNSAPKKNSTGNTALRTSVADKASQKSSVTAKIQTPRLTESEDEEDDSIRLADLFDELGTR